MVKKKETFEEMIQRLKREGLLDENGGMTNKGHAYVEQTKRVLQEEQARVMSELTDAEGHDAMEIVHDEIWECAEAA